MVANVDIESPHGKSDHACITFDFLCEANKKDMTRTFRLYEKADNNTLRTKLAGSDWIQNLDWSSDMDMYNMFLDSTTHHVQVASLQGLPSRIRDVHQELQQQK